MEVTIENLERAVSQFYHSDSSMQAQAHQWLTAAQNSPQAWAFVWELLQPHRSGEVQFFAATTLHNKVMRNWSEVPADQYGQLKEKILESIIQYSTGPKIVLNRLCIALSAFVIQTTPYFWRDSLSDLMTLLTPANFPNIPPERIIWILLEIFSVIPEEFDTMTLSQKHKSMIRNDLESAANGVMSMLETVIGCGASNEIETQAVKTAVSWLHFGICLPNCLNLARKLVELVISGQCSECGEMELEAIYQMVTHPDTHRFPQAILTLLDVIIPLAQLTTDPENSELVYNVYRVFVAIAESHTSLFLKSLSRDECKTSVESLLRIILACTAGPGDYLIQETHSQLTFGLWYIVQDEMVNLTEVELAAARNIIVPVYEEVATILLAKSRYPPDGVQLSAQDSETFRCYRQDIADTMMYCYCVVRQYLIGLLVSSLREAKTWQEVEAVYHVAFSLAETVAADDDATIVSLLASPPAHCHQLINTKVINTLNQSIGAYSEWLIDHTDTLSSLIPRLVSSLDSVETATSATMALKDITRDCYTSLKPMTEPLYTSCQEALNKGHLKQNECNRLMFSMGKLLSLMPYETMVRHIQPLLASQVHSLQQIVQQASQANMQDGADRSKIDEVASTAVTNRLKMLSQLLSTLYLDSGVPEPPAFIALSNLMPLLVSLSQVYLHDNNIIQEICNCLKNGVSSLLERCEPLLESIIGILVTCYSAQPNPAALDLVRNIVLLFGGTKEDCVQSVARPLLSSVTNTTMALAPRSSEHCDIIQAYHILMATVVKRKPFLIVASVDCHQMFAFATSCLVMAEFSCVKAAGSLICNIVSLGREEAALLDVVRRGGLNLTVTCLTAIGGDCPRNSLEVVCEVILSLNKKFCDDLGRWLSDALGRDGFPSPRASHSVKSAFSRTIIKERANRRKLQEAVREFSMICRGLVTTDYVYQPPPDIVQ